MTEKIIKDYIRFESGNVCIILNKELKTREEHEQFFKEIENENTKK